MPLVQLHSRATKSLETMSDSADLTGDGGVMKTVVRRAKPDAVTPSESLPLVDGMLILVLFILYFIEVYLEIF